LRAEQLAADAEGQAGFDATHGSIKIRFPPGERKKNVE